MSKPNGYTLFQGPSLLDGADIVVIATGIRTKSQNSKTGAMIQTYILRSDMNPLEASKQKLDASICGDCPHRQSTGGACYVNLGHGPAQVYKSYLKGNYPKLNADSPEWDLFKGRMIRFGAYGDPAAVRVSLWAKLAGLSKSFSGYTHQWKNISAAWAPYVMASVDSEEEQIQASLKGFRTFRIKTDELPNRTNEISCPASEEMGKRTTCESCGLCAGISKQAKNITINVHGSWKKRLQTV